MRIQELTCKRCAAAFVHKRVSPGASPRYCSFKCNYEERLERKATGSRERYGRMRQAGVDPQIAHKASWGCASTERALAELAQRTESQP